MTQLICIGEALFEFNAQPDGSYGANVGGDVSNVAIAAARHKADVQLITHVGADCFGDDLLALWAREGVDTANVKSIGGQDTGLYFVHHDDTGHHFTYRRKGSASSLMTKVDIDEAAVKRAEMLYTSGITLAASDTLQQATIHAISVARGQNARIAIDPNLREKLWPLEQARRVTHDVMRNCDIALPSLDDARRLTGLWSPEDIVGFYHDIGAGIVALTLGADGVAISTDDGLSIISGTKVTAVDATGAGDCFNGVFLANLLNGISPTAAAQTANIAAAYSTTSLGAVASIPYPNDITKKG